LFIYFFEGRMFSHRIVTNITSARGTLHCRNQNHILPERKDETEESVSPQSQKASDLSPHPLCS